MSYPPQQPGGWSDPSWPQQQPPSQPEQTTPYPPAAPYPPNAPQSGQPYSGAPYGSPQPAAPHSGSPYDPNMTNPYDPSAQPISGGQPPAPYGGYGYPAYAPAAGPTTPTNGMAVASMVVSIVAALGLCAYGLGGWLGIVGAILGHVSRRQIRERGEGGDGMALAGVIIGWIATAIAVIATIGWVVFIVWVANQEPSSFDNTNNLDLFRLPG